MEPIAPRLPHTFARDRVKKVDTTEGAGDERKDFIASTLKSDTGIATNVGEDVALALLNQGKLDVVAVGEKVFEAVKPGSQKTQSLKEILLPLVAAVFATELDAVAQKVAKKLGRSHNASPLIRNVVLHASLGVDGKLDALINGTTKSTVISSSILVIGIVLGVIDVLLRAVAAEPVSRHLELLRAIAKGEETQHAENETDGLSRDGLDRADVDGLRVDGSRRKRRTVDAFDFGQAGNVTSAKGQGWLGEADQDDQPNP
ncbi:hypothetical protein HYQ46_003363 [Verticillium longisporum]|nr:hypothetical protein HYQ46_003363 [Verticillium longisporum]